jgi:hypothetical protein
LQLPNSHFNRRPHLPRKPQAEIDRIAGEALTTPVIEKYREPNHLSEASVPSLTKRRDQP